MLEPLGVAHNGVERLEVHGEDVLVIGCGPVGLLAQRLAKVMGAKRSVSFMIRIIYVHGLLKISLKKAVGVSISFYAFQNKLLCITHE